MKREDLFREKEDIEFSCIQAKLIIIVENSCENISNQEEVNIWELSW